MPTDESKCEANKPKRVVIAGKSSAFHQWIEQIIGTVPEVKLCGKASDLEQLKALLREEQADILVLGSFPAPPDAVKLIEFLARVAPSVAILVLARDEFSPCVGHAFKAGASGYVPQTVAGPGAFIWNPTTRIVDALHALARGERYFSMGDGIIWDPDPSHPSPAEVLGEREMMLFRMVGEGLTTEQIVAKLGVARKTVEHHCQHIELKLGMKNPQELRRAARIFVEGNFGL